MVSCIVTKCHENDDVYLEFNSHFRHESVMNACMHPIAAT